MNYFDIKKISQRICIVNHFLSKEGAYRVLFTVSEYRIMKTTGIGLIFLILLMVPNVLWTKNKPRDYEEYAADEKECF